MKNTKVRLVSLALFVCVVVTFYIYCTETWNATMFTRYYSYDYVKVHLAKTGRVPNNLEEFKSFVEPLGGREGDPHTTMLYVCNSYSPKVAFQNKTTDGFEGEIYFRGLFKMRRSFLISSKRIQRFRRENSVKDGIPPL